MTIAGTLEETPGSSIAKRVGRAPTICPHIVRGIYVLLLHINSVSITRKGLFLEVAGTGRTAEGTPVGTGMV